jgi:hypothetical protein
VRVPLALPALLVALAGCGGSTTARPPDADLPPAAQPARSPVPTATPAGRTIRVGPLADAVAADPSAHTFAVAVHDPSRLVLVDSRTGRIRERVAVPTGQRHPGPPPAPAVFLVPAEFGKRALAIQPADRTPPQQRPQSAAVVLGRTFVADAGGATVAVLDRGRPVAHLPAATRSGGLSAAAFDRRLAVVAVRERALELYDPRTLRRVARIAAGAGPTNVVEEGDRLYVADTRGQAILVFTTGPRLARAARIPLPGAPYGLALDPVRRRLWVTLTARNEVVSLPTDGSAGRPLRLPTVQQPDAVAVDSARGIVAVTGRADGVLQLIPRSRAYPADDSARAALRRAAGAAD